MSTTAAPAISYSMRLRELALEHPAAPAVVVYNRAGDANTMTWDLLHLQSTRLAHAMAAQGVDEDGTVVIGLPTGHEHVIAAHAAWKLGALVIPINHAMPSRERDELLALIAPTIVVGDWPEVPWATIPASEVWTEAYGDEQLPDVIARPGEAVPSGGSTGRPKIIVADKAALHEPDRDMSADFGLRFGQTQLVPGALYYSLGFNRLHHGLMHDHRILLMEKFDAAHAVDLIERERVSFIATVPTVMRRIVEQVGVADRDFSSMECLYHTGAPCPPWVKKAWIDLIGPEQVLEGFGASEAIGRTQIRGDEWLKHPGSVGRPWHCELKVVNEDGSLAAPGEIGQVWTRPHGRNSGSRYIGTQQLEPDAEGYYTVGDLGSVDEDGYVYFADRRVDMILSGGANVFPAEVEAALVAHPLVADVAVIGIPDPDWGRRVHAVVEPITSGAPLTDTALDAFARRQLAAYKVPKTYEFIERLPREDSGKIRRGALAAERSGAVD